MIPRTLLVLAAVVCIAADAPKELQGKWTVTKMERGGKEDKDAIGDTLTVDGDKFTIKIKKDESREMKGTFTVDTAKKPPTVDLVMTDPEGKEHVMPGLYHLDGDTIKFCFPNMRGGDRPKEIAAKDDTMVVTLKKDKK